MQTEEKKSIVSENTQSQEHRGSQPKLLKNALEKYPFKIKKKMSNKEVFEAQIINRIKN